MNSKPQQFNSIDNLDDLFEQQYSSDELISETLDEPQFNENQTELDLDSFDLALESDEDLDLDLLLQQNTSPTDLEANLASIDNLLESNLEKTLNSEFEEDLDLELSASANTSVDLGLDDLDAMLEDSDDMSDLDAMLEDSDDMSDLDAMLEDSDDMSDLDAMLEDSDDIKTSDLNLEELNQLLEDDNSNLTTIDDLDSLLDESDSAAIPSPPPAITPVPAPAETKRAFEETMRVPVRQLDNLSNMIGELVIKRNQLEDDQNRLRQFIDNLLAQVQKLNDVGTKMKELYERSLLEGSLIASRQPKNGASSQKDTDTETNTETKSQGDELSALEMDQFSEFHLLSQDIIELIVRVKESVSDVQYVVDTNGELAQNLRQVTAQLQDGITKSRMVAFAQTADRLPRAVRDIAFKLNKQAELDISGKQTLIDKMIVEHLYNPMTHIVNNAVTHGIESPEERVQKGKSRAGLIKINAFLQGNETVITVSDDGAGINPERVKAKAVEKGLITTEEAAGLSEPEIYNLLFRPGFSTRDQADDFAGRGVGMDVVATDLKKIHGKVSIDSQIDQGTTFTIRLPLTLSISKALCCLTGKGRIAFPMDGVEAIRECSKSEITTDEDGIEYLAWDNDTTLPIWPIERLFTYNRQLSRSSIYQVKQEEDNVCVVVLRSTNHLLAVKVCQIVGEQEIVIKQIVGPIPKPAGIAGATILGDGSVVPIADVLELLEIAQGRRSIDFTNEKWEQDRLRHASRQKAMAKPLVLVVDDSITVRELLSMSFQKLDYRVEQARDGQEAWDKLRSGLPCDLIFCDIEMPRMNGLELLSNLQQDPDLKEIPVTMLTSRGADKHRNLATELGASAYLTKPYTEKELMDVAQRMLALKQKSLNDTETFIQLEADLQAEIEALNLGFTTDNTESNQLKPNPSVLIVDDSITVRELLSMTFQKAGYQVQQARDGQQALEKLQELEQVDVIICDVEMPRMNGFELLAKLRQIDHLSHIPVAMLTSRGAEKHRKMAAELGAKGYLTKPYIEDALLDTSKRLIAGEVLLDS